MGAGMNDDGHFGIAHFDTGCQKIPNDGYFIGDPFTIELILHSLVRVAGRLYRDVYRQQYTLFASR
jgi:hypothetical protein